MIKALMCLCVIVFVYTVIGVVIARIVRAVDKWGVKRGTLQSWDRLVITPEDAVLVTFLWPLVAGVIVVGTALDAVKSVVVWMVGE